MQEHIKQSEQGTDRSGNRTARCAIYARCAASEQSATAIENQIRGCTEWAQRNGWTIVQEFVQADVAASGTSLEGRSALVSLMKAAEQNPRPFGRVLIADASRLARSLTDLLRISKHFERNNVQVVSVSQGPDLSDIRAFSMPLTVEDEQFLARLREKLGSSPYCPKCQGRIKQ
jgi:DNA invertase Pin-like site-specific DNA recombinase